MCHNVYNYGKYRKENKKMKRIIPIFMVIVVCAVSQAGFDYTISDTYKGGIVMLEGEESLLVIGAGAHQIHAKDYSYVEVQNTSALTYSTGGIYTLLLNDYSTLNYSGGQTGGIGISDNAEAILSGGVINNIASHQNSDLKKHITIICDVDSVNLTGDLLTGNWLDGSSFSITLQDQAGYDSVYSNIQLVPEPTTLLLFGLGSVLLRRKK